MTLACEVDNLKLVEVVTVAHVDDEKRVDNILLQIWKVKCGHKVDFMTKLYLPSLHQTIVNTFLSINISNFKNLNKH